MKTSIVVALTFIATPAAANSILCDFTIVGEHGGIVTGVIVLDDLTKYMLVGASMEKIVVAGVHFPSDIEGGHFLQVPRRYCFRSTGRSTDADRTDLGVLAKTTMAESL